MQLAKMLVYYCKKRGLTMNALAQKTGIPPATLHGWKTGRSGANFSDLKKVSSALQVGLHELVFGGPDPFEQPGEEILKEIFSGDVRVTLHRIEKLKE